MGLTLPLELSMLQNRVGQIAIEQGKVMSGWMLERKGRRLPLRDRVGRSGWQAAKEVSFSLSCARGFQSSVRREQGGKKDDRPEYHDHWESRVSIHDRSLLDRCR